jgi:hypothetical protein
MSVEQEIPGVAGAMASVASLHAEDKDKHSFEFTLCWNEKELNELGITTDFDELGNMSFMYDNVCLGYLLDIPGEPFMFAVHFGIPRTHAIVAEGINFNYRWVRPVFKPGRRYWKTNDAGKPVKVKEPALNWHDTTLTAAEFRYELTRRLVTARDLYESKRTALQLKFDMVQKHMRRALGDEECIELINVQELTLIKKFGIMQLLNGNVMEVFGLERSDDVCSWIMHRYPKACGTLGKFLMYDGWLYIVRFSLGDYCPTVVYKIAAVRIGRLKEIIDDIAGHSNGPA